ncbi:MAG TPA: T9SS type A sorting domain-containing protein, partial [Lentimicrobium sp.]|nr:T9SS type A sorting domain-containing protein [Lentimicrobium sp.]
ISIGIDRPENSGLAIYSYNKEIRVQTENTGKLSLMLYNLQGQQVYSGQLQGSNHYFLNLNIPSGIYVASIISDSRQFSYKLIVR